VMEPRRGRIVRRSFMAMGKTVRHSMLPPRMGKLKMQQ
jgi:hypothetical protein